MFTVQVHSYSLAAHRVGTDLQLVWEHSHRSPRAAARTLASVIANRTEFAREVQAKVGTGRGGRFTIVTPEGSEWALTPFRTTLGLK
jgi:hypothetical protein